MPQPIDAGAMQGHLEIKEIKDDMLILKDRGIRAVLMASGLDFALKSTEEQEAVVLRYQDFLNSLDFSVQIVVNSRKFNVDQYMSFLEKCQTQQDNELLRLQMIEYMDFIKGLTQMANIMSNFFYVIIPYNPFEVSSGNFLDTLLGRKKESSKTEKKEKTLQEIKISLWQRVDFVVTGLRAMGVNAAPLKTEELIELFYKLYNPGAREKLAKKEKTE